MKIDMLEVANAMNDVQSAYEDLEVAFRQSEEVAGMMENVHTLYAEVLDLGFCPEIKNKIETFHGLESLTSLSKEKIIRYSSTEGIGEAVKNTAQRFWEAIKEFFQKIADFFAKVFSTFDYKCRQILLHLNAIDFDKEVATLTKDTFFKLLITGADVQAFSQKTYKYDVSQNLHTVLDNYRIALMRLSNAHLGVLKIEDNRLQLDPKSYEFETKTLKDTGFSIADIGKLTKMFQERTNNYSKIGAFFKSMVKEYEAASLRIKSDDPNMFKDIQTAIRNQGFVCRLLAQIQSVTCKQITAFFKCIGDVVSMNPNPQGQLGYAG